MQIDELIKTLIDGDQHNDGLKCLKLFTVNASFMNLLKQEVEQFCQDKQSSDVNKPGHVTRWTQPSGNVLQYSLLNSSGSTQDFNDDHDLSCKGKWFFDQDSYLNLGQLIACWPHLINFRIHILGSGSGLQAHEEHIAFHTVNGGVGARLRFHLPVKTNLNAELNLDGEVFHLQTGEISLINQGCVHSAVNNGHQARLHLVWDSLLTEKLYTFLFSNKKYPGFFDTATNPIHHNMIRKHDIGPYVRLPASVPKSKLTTLQLCAPQ